MAFNDIQELYFASAIPIDRIIGTFEGTFTAPPPGGGTPEVTNRAVATLIPESTFFQGIFSVDGGTTWNDFNTVIQAGGANELVVSGRSNSDLFTVRASNSSFVALNSYTVSYKFALIAKLDQGDITPQPNGDDIVFDSRFNYQKISSDTSETLSIANLTNSTVTIAHGLGYIPKIRSFTETTSTFAGFPAGMYETSFLAKEAFSAGPTSSAGVQATSGICMDTSNIYVDLNNQGGVGNFSATLFMRVYYDA